MPLELPVCVAPDQCLLLVSADLIESAMTHSARAKCASPRKWLISTSSCQCGDAGDAG
jgi:hypothetical protein